MQSIVTIERRSRKFISLKKRLRIEMALNKIVECHTQNKTKSKPKNDVQR